MEPHSSTLRVLQILEYLGQNNNSTLEDITICTKIPYTTAYRILQTCLKSNFVELTSEKHYKLTPKLFQIASSQMQLHTSLASRAHPHLQKLFYNTKETVHLAILSGDKALYIDKIDSQHALRMYSRIGNEADLYCTGVGKALLAWLTDSVQQTLVESFIFTKYTKNTITDKETLRKHLKKICKQGYAEDNEEHGPHIYCLAVPVFDENNYIVASISVSSPIVRLTKSFKEQVTKSLWDCGKNLSKMLGNKNYHDCLNKKS